MADVILKTVVTFCICYTVLNFIIHFFDKVFSGESIPGDKMFVVIKVLSKEENLEYIVRSVNWKNLRMSGYGDVPNVLIVDMSGDEQTSMIGKRLANDYEFIYYTNHDDVGDVIKSIKDAE